MSKKNLISNPYRMGDENHLYFSDEKILKTFIRHLGFVNTYFRYTVEGIKYIPKKGPALLVLNHGFIPIDLFLLARHVYAKTGRRIRVLIHHRSWRIPVLREVALNLGLVNATPDNAVRLLKRGELVAVFPGGEREGLKPSSQKYQLLWEGRYGFIKTALRAQVPMIPCMAAGIDDIFFIFKKPSVLQKELIHRFFPLPFFFGIGGFPIPRKIIHTIGKPFTAHLSPKRSGGGKAVMEVHAQVWKTCQRLLQRGLKKRKWYFLE